MLWALLGGLVLLAVGLALWPLLVAGSGAAPSRGGAEIALYRRQLADIDGDLEKGLIGAAEAGPARLEIERRLLAAGEGLGTAQASAARQHPFIAVALALIIPAAAFALYGFYGSPALPDAPWAARADVAQSPRQAEMQALVAKLARRMESDPDNLTGWLLLGRSYAAMGRHDDAVGALRRGLALDPANNSIKIAVAENMVLAAAGTVPPDARKLFEEAARAATPEPAAIYYLGLAEYQQGLADKALRRWQALAAGAPADAPWLAAVKARIAEVSEKLGRPVPSVAPSAPPSPPSGPDADAIAAAGKMTADERATMISAMVARLAARLKERPDDLEGWLRLGRSYRVLGRDGEARAALMKARDLMAAGDRRRDDIDREIAALTGE